MKFLRLITLLLVTVVMGDNLYAQKDLNKLMQERGEYYFSLNANETNGVTAINKLCSVAKLDGNTIICYANQEQYDNLLKHGYKPTLLTPPSLQNEIAMWNGRGTYDWDSYPTYQQYESMMHDYATQHPERCSYFELGTLASGRKLMFCRINNGQTEGKPKFLYTSTIHGDETGGYILLLRLLDELCTSNDERILNIVNNIDIFICPCTNPDGTYHGGNNTVSGATRGNANGIDMNRNYPDFSVGPHPDGYAYQQETEWMMQLADDYTFTMAANYHGGSEVMNYIWDNYRPLSADDDWWQMVCHEYADLCHEVNPNYMNSFNNGITNGAVWYMIAGGRQDYMNYYKECREVTIECSNSYTPSGSQLPQLWNTNHNSMLTYLEEVLYGIHGVVTDSVTGQPLVGATITIDGHDHHGSSVTSHEAGDYHRPIKGGTYTVTYSANGYFPKSYTLTIGDHETLIQDVQLRAGEGLIPDFEATTTSVALNGSTNFIDKTWGANLVSWEWTFEGGNPATSTEQNPTGISYATNGDYAVTLSVTNADGQTETITKSNYIHVKESYNMQDGTITTCNALFYDDNGPESNYGNNKNYTMTFKPGNDNAVLQVRFNEFSTESGWDFLYIYDGSSTSSTQIGKYSGNENPGTITATNAEGALTFKFTSDQNTTSSGWVATIACIFTNPLQVEVTADPEVINEGESAQLKATATGGSGEYTYSWEPAESLNNPFIAEPIATPGLPTTYKVTVSDGTNTVEGEVFIDIRDLGISENDLQNIMVYPNPAKSVLNIEGRCDYRLTNCLGQTIAEGCNESKTQIDLSGISEGIYFLNLSDGSNCRTQKIVIQ